MVAEVTPARPNPTESEEAPIDLEMPTRLILYDGVCGFCNRAVRWVIRADRQDRFRFATLQGSTGQAIRARHPEVPDDLDSILYVRRSESGERVAWRAAAILEICADLPGLWRVLSGLRLLPNRVLDLGYCYFAANRYRWFGKHDTCPLPTAAERARFLD